MPKKNSFKRLATRTVANTGAKLIVNGPDGKPTEDWITVRGTDSDAFQKAKRTSTKEIFAYIEANGGVDKVKDTPDYMDLTMQQGRVMQASLVIDWSFDEPCTPENVLELFTEAPYVGQQVDEFAGKRDRFVMPMSSYSEPLPIETSSSTPLPLAPPQPQHAASN